MGDRARLQKIVAKLDGSENYTLARMLMLRVRLTREQWNVFERCADAICDCILNQLPADHPESVIWDNRRKRPFGR